jgi:hypothetical protein
VEDPLEEEDFLAAEDSLEEEDHLHQSLSLQHQWSQEDGGINL